MRHMPVISARSIFCWCRIARSLRRPLEAPPMSLLQRTVHVSSEYAPRVVKKEPFLLMTSPEYKVSVDDVVEDAFPPCSTR